jgi:hypothetical protein
VPSNRPGADVGSQARRSRLSCACDPLLWRKMTVPPTGLQGIDRPSAGGFAHPLKRGSDLREHPLAVVLRHPVQRLQARPKWAPLGVEQTLVLVVATTEPRGCRPGRSTARSSSITAPRARVQAGPRPSAPLADLSLGSGRHHDLERQRRIRDSSRLSPLVRQWPCLHEQASARRNGPATRTNWPTRSSWSQLERRKVVEKARKAREQ